MSEDGAWDRSTVIGSAVAGPVGGVIAFLLGPGIANAFRDCATFQSPLPGIPSRAASTSPPCDLLGAAQLADADKPWFIIGVAVLAVVATFAFFSALAAYRASKSTEGGS
jgi:hypothetical protein